jgi:exodeoxyribonuclease VIII
MDVERSVLHYLKKKQETTPAMAFGTLSHTMILEPQTFHQKFVIQPKIDRRTNAGKIAWNKLVAGAGDRTIVSVDDYECVTSMAEVLRSIPFEFKESFQSAHKEVSGFIDLEGVKMRCRMDAYDPVNNIVWEYKTTQDASIDGFKNKSASFKYHMQGACYAWLTKLIHARHGIQIEMPKFLILAQETEAPFEFCVYQYDDAAMQIGYEKIQKALERWREFLKNPSVPQGYSKNVNALDLPAWAYYIA